MNNSIFEKFVWEVCYHGCSHDSKELLQTDGKRKAFVLIRRLDSYYSMKQEGIKRGVSEWIRIPQWGAYPPYMEKAPHNHKYFAEM